MSLDPLTTATSNVWEKHPNELYRQDQSHYRGVGRWANDEDWLNIGRSTLRKIQELWGFLGRPADGLKDQVILEWGPGGGANAYGLKDVSSLFFGIDISEKNLKEASRVLAAEKHVSYFQPILLEGEPGTVIASVVPKVNLFFSTAVFQHFPSRDYGCSVLKALRGVCQDNAAGFIQIRFDNGREKYRGISRIEDYEKRHIFANSYPIEEFWDHCLAAGFRPLYVNAIRSANNYATFYLAAD